MKKYATSVILQGYSNSRNARTVPRAASPRTEAAAVPAPPNRRAVDPVRGFPSPKNTHTPGIRSQRRSPFPDPDYHEENQTWLSLSGNEHNQSTDAEQQSMLASVLEPETHHKLKKLVEDQKHQSAVRPLSKLTASAPGYPSKSVVEEREENIAAATVLDDDGAMSDRTQATSQLWSSQASQLDEHALQTMSFDDLMSITQQIQREMERRARSAQSPALPPPPSATPPVGSHTPTPSGTPAPFVDQQAVESRKNFKRTKSGGNESAFNNPRSRTPQPKSSGAYSGQSKLDLHNEDPELLSVHSDALNSSASNTLIGSAQPPNNSNSGSSGQPPAATSNFGVNNMTNSASSMPAGRPVSRTNGALHPHDKMLYGHRNTALPCLSPMDNALPQSSPLDFNLNSRSSSRPPSRGATLANFEDRLNSSLGGGSQSLGGNLLTAAALSLTNSKEADAIIPIEAVNISSAKEMTLDQFLTSNRPAAYQQNVGGLQREVSRGELVLSPFCAFDDISLGSSSLTSSISSRQQQHRRHRSRRDSSTTATSATSVPPVVSVQYR